MKQPRFNFSKLQRKWEIEKERLAIEIARKAENQFKDNFRLSGFLYDSLELWQPRKKPDPGRAILVKSGRLKRGIRSLPGSNFTRIQIANDVPYARYHNEGSNRLPQRKFMGNSRVLNVKIKQSIKTSLRKVFT